MSDEPLDFDAVNEALGYNPDTGQIWWKIKPARNVLAGTEAGAVKATRRSVAGKTTSYRYIRLHGIVVPAQRIAWLLHYGEWPPARIGFKDADPLNIAIDNLELGRKVVSEFDKAAYGKAHREQFPLYWKEKHLQTSFGIGLREYGQMLVAQGGKCAICRQEETEIRAGTVKALAVDHDHKTDQVRGLLCVACNTGLGKFGDDPVRLRAAAAYIESYAASNVHALRSGDS